MAGSEKDELSNLQGVQRTERGGNIKKKNTNWRRRQKEREAQRVSPGCMSCPEFVGRGARGQYRGVGKGEYGRRPLV